MGSMAGMGNPLHGYGKRTWTFKWKDINGGSVNYNAPCRKEMDVLFSRGR